MFYKCSSECPLHLTSCLILIHFFISNTDISVKPRILMRYTAVSAEARTDFVRLAR